MSENSSSRGWVYLTIVFISGAAVMSFEILAARAIAPVYGQSLHVWASVIGLTLGALTLGYFLGGWLIDRRPDPSTLSLTLLAAALSTGVMPLLATYILELTEPLGLRFGALVASFLLLVAPLTALGMITPAVTRLATRSVENVGKTAGTIYAVSTLGGILSSFGCGFYTIPYWGILATAIVTAVSLVAAAALAGLAGRLKAAAGGSALVLFAIPVVSAWLSATRAPHILVDTDGLLGRLTVVATPEERLLFIDGVGQTRVDRSGRSLFQYVHCLTFFAGHYPKGANVLVLGLGGGSLANELVRLEFNVDAVELDERIARIARDHFALDPAVNVFVDDARRYVRACNKRYSFIGLDCFTAEREPTHLLTIESIRDMSRVLEPDGMFVLDYRGYLDGSRGLGARCILRTIEEAGYQPIAYGTAAGEDDRDLILGGLRNPKRFWRERSLRLNQECCGAAANEMTKHVLQCDLDNAYVLTDDCSPLDVLNTVYHERWRISAREGFAEMLRGR